MNYIYKHFNLVKPNTNYMNLLFNQIKLEVSYSIKSLSFLQDKGVVTLIIDYNCFERFSLFFFMKLKMSDLNPIKKTVN